MLMSQFDCYQLQLVYPTVAHNPANLQHEILQTTFGMFSQSQHILHTLQRSFLYFSCIFIFLEIIKHNMLKMLLFSSLVNIKMSTQKSTVKKKNLHVDMTAVTIQSNKIVLNEVKEN